MDLATNTTHMLMLLVWYITNSNVTGGNSYLSPSFQTGRVVMSKEKIKIQRKRKAQQQQQQQ